MEDKQSDCFEELYNRYADKIYRKTHSMTQNEEDAKDLSHNIFIKIFTSLSAFKQQASFATWIYRITYNESINFLKKKSRQLVSVLEEEEITDDIEDKSNLDIEKQILYDIKISKLREYLQQITPEERAVLLMKYQDDLGVKDIADTINVSQSAVKMRLLRARNRIYELFQKDKDLNIF
ncbi:MAG: RNA polymerase sigma factor [Sphingobacteriales bacterium]|nr:RNA polymerase sigma factor [Sphingobacteriales bacterium]